MKDTMKALVYHGPNDYSLDDVPMPKIEQPTDVIVRITLGAICGSDLPIVAGLQPVEPGRIIGHEFCGEVVEVGDAVKKRFVGEKVAASCIAFCGSCYPCSNHQVVHCEDPDGGCYGTPASHLNGAQAEYIRVPFGDNDLVPIPEGLTEEDVIFTGDILSTGYYAVRNANIQHGDTVLVVGNGPVGKCAMECVQKLTGAGRVIVASRNQGRLDFDLEHGLADIAINTLEKDVVEEVMKITDGHGADACIEAIGKEVTLMQCIDACKIGGTVSTVGVFEDAITLPLERLWLFNKSINWGFVTVDKMPELVELIRCGKLDLRFLQTHKGRLNDIVDGYRIFGERIDNCIKWLFTPYEE